MYVILQLQAKWYAIPVNALQHTNTPNRKQVIQIAAAKFSPESFFTSNYLGNHSYINHVTLHTTVKT